MRLTQPKRKLGEFDGDIQKRYHRVKARFEGVEI
jgi:hypothetical protein